MSGRQRGGETAVEEELVIGGTDEKKRRDGKGMEGLQKMKALVKKKLLWNGREEIKERTH